MTSITFICLWVPCFKRQVSIYNCICWKWPLALVQIRAWTLISGSEGQSPVSLPPPASLRYETAATLGSRGNSSWHPAIHVARDIPWEDPFFKNHITSPCLINLTSQKCISPLLFLHLPYSWYKWSVTAWHYKWIFFSMFNVFFFLKHFFSLRGEKYFTSAL